MPLIALCLGLLLSWHSPVSAGTLSDPNLVTEVIVQGLSQPTAMAFYGDGDFLVLEKFTGKVRNVVDRVPGADALDLAVESGGERGLLGIAVHPSFPAQPFVYLFYTPSSTGADTNGVAPNPNRVERYQFGNGVLTNPSTILTLLQPPTSNIHNGGTMAFGPDGKLYVIVGDRGANGGLQNVGALGAADDTSVIFRLNEDGDAPGDNPLSHPSLDLTKYFAYGIRNSFGLAFDPMTGDLWDTENGPGSYDELNRVLPGFNSGWNLLMGPDARDTDDTAADLTVITGGAYSDPEFSWRDTIAPTGLAFLSGSALGDEYQDSLVVGDFNDGAITRFRLNAARDAIAPPHPDLADLVLDPGDNLSGIAFGSDFGGAFNGVTDLKLGPDGRLYGVSIDGEVFVIRRAVEGPASEIRDLALTKLAASKRVTLSSKRPVKTAKIKLQLQNRGPAVETLQSAAILEALVSVDVVSLAGGVCPQPVVELVPPTKRFPLALKSKQKLSLAFRVDLDCANDPAASKKSAPHADFAVTATLHRDALDGLADTHAADDACPRPPLPFGVDPNPDGKVKDKGCGAKVSKSARGGAVEIDVVQK